LGLARPEDLRELFLYLVDGSWISYLGGIRGTTRTYLVSRPLPVAALESTLAGAWYPNKILGGSEMKHIMRIATELPSGGVEK